MPKPISHVSQYVVLPTRGLRATTPTSSGALSGVLRELTTVHSTAAAQSFMVRAGVETKQSFQVLDSIHEDGAKLIEMTPEAMQDLQAAQPGLRIVPVIYYRTARHVRQIEAKVKAAAAAVKVIITVVSAGDGKLVAGAMVVAFTDFANKVGAQGTTNARGVVRLSLGASSKIEQLYVYPKKDFWGALQKNLGARGKAGISIALTPIDLSYVDALRHYYSNAPLNAGNRVTVGVVDTGVGPHPDLVVTGGLNCVQGEQPKDYGDNGEGHGSHVGGIIAARGNSPAGIRGLAPAVALRSYRVFGKGAQGASNFAIAKAIDAAAGDGCDLINLSLGGGPSDPATQSAIHDARQQGCVVVAAAGNENRGPVDFPAADPLCIAVSALGRKGSFPKGVVEDGDVMGPFGNDKDEFIASFSNVGPEVNLTGTGVGILSTVPGGYAAMSGTSMACPAVVGFAARMLAGLPNILSMPRDQSRSDEIAKAFLQSAKDRGFPAEMQGKGLPL